MPSINSPKKSPSVAPTASITAEVFAMGRAAAADWLSDNHTHAKPISLAKCRAVRLTDMVLQYEALPQFDELLASWDSKVAIFNNTTWDTLWLVLISCPAWLWSKAEA